MMLLRIREVRKQCGLTMKELGDRIGVGESTISQYETGKRQPDYEVLLRIADYFGVSVDYLLGKVELKVSDSSHTVGKMEIGEFVLTEFERQLILSYRGTDPGTQRSVEKLLDLESVQKENDLRASGAKEA